MALRPKKIVYCFGDVSRGMHFGSSCPRQLVGGGLWIVEKMPYSDVFKEINNFLLIAAVFLRTIHPQLRRIDQVHSFSLPVVRTGMPTRPQWFPPFFRTMRLSGFSVSRHFFQITQWISKL
jgi:hypothetical protein